MTANAKKNEYPYSKSRVYVSIIMAFLSVLLAAILFQSDPTSAFTYVLYYLLSTIVMTIATFLLKMRLYPVIANDSLTTDQPPEQTKTSGSARKTLVAVFFMLVASILVPLLLAPILGGPAWVILMISFISGVSISETVFYLYSR